MELLSFNVYVSKLLLLWPENGNYNTNYAIKNFLILFIVNVSGLTSVWGFFINIVRINKIDVAIDAGIAVIDFFGFFYMRTIFLKKITKIFELLKDLEMFVQFCPMEYISQTDSKVQKYTKLLLIYGIMGNAINCVLPLYNKKNCYLRRGSDVDFSHDPCGLMTRCYYPIDVSKTLFYLAYFIQIYSCIIISVTVLIITMTQVSVMYHITFQIQYCRKLIRQLLEHEDDGEETLKLKLGSIIRYHVRIIKFSEDTNEAFSSMMFIHITLTSLVISVLGYVIVIADDLMDSLRYSLHLFGWLILLFLVCYYGQLLIDESNELADDIYFMEWFKCAPKMQKDIKMVLMRAQKPLTLSAANFGIMSLQTYLSILSSAYSYFTLLLKIKI